MGEEAKTFKDILCQFVSKKRIRISFTLIGSIIIYLIVSGHKPNSILPWISVSGFIGTLITFGGVFMRSWAAGVIKKQKTLATDGPYALCRHPLYLGSFFMALGFLIIIGHYFATLAVIAIILSVYIPTIRKEERVISEHFQDSWPDYTRDVGLIFPKRLTNRIWISWSFSQWFSNKEFQASLATIVALILVQFWYQNS